MGIVLVAEIPYDLIKDFRPFFKQRRHFLKVKFTYRFGAHKNMKKMAKTSLAVRR